MAGVLVEGRMPVEHQENLESTASITNKAEADRTWAEEKRFPTPAPQS